MKENKYRRECRYCGRIISGGESCSYCKDRVDIFREIKALILNKVKQEERERKNSDRQMRNMW